MPHPVRCQPLRLDHDPTQAVLARCYEPEDTAPIAAVLIAPAMGVVARFYRHFAEWLAGQGLRVMIFDYRGIGESLDGPLSSAPWRIDHWVEDCARALAALREMGSEPVAWMGHSLGGQVAPLVRGIDGVSRIVTVAAGNGYWRLYRPPLLFFAPWLWWVSVPLAVRLTGHFPGRKLRKLGDLPGPAIMQWRSWCLNQDYLLGVEGPGARQAFEAIRQPLTAISMADDRFLSRESVDSLHRFHRNAELRRLHLQPREEGLARIGHFDLFRPEVGQALWSRHLLPALLGPG